MRQLGIIMCVIGVSVAVAIFISLPGEPRLLVWGFTSDMAGGVVFLAGLLLIVFSNEQYWTEYNRSQDGTFHNELDHKQLTTIQKRWVAQITCDSIGEPPLMVSRIRSIGLSAQMVSENTVAVGPFRSIEIATIARHQLANELRVFAQLTPVEDSREL